MIGILFAIVVGWIVFGVLTAIVGPIIALIAVGLWAAFMLGFFRRA